MKRTIRVSMCLVALLAGVSSPAVDAADHSATAERQAHGKQAGFRPLPSQPELARYGLTRAWFTQVSIDPRRDHVTGLTLDDGRLYVQTSLGTVEALDTATGARAWLTRVGRPDLVSFAPAANDDTLLVINGSQLYALDKTNGSVRWDLRVPTAPSTSPSASETNVFVSLVDGRLWGYSLDETEDEPSYLRAWWYATSQPIEVPALPYNDLVCFANDGGSLFVVDVGDRSLLYQYETDAAIAAPLDLYVAPPADEQSDPRPIVIMASRDQFVYGIDLMTGANLWQFTNGREIFEPPVVVGDELYVIPALSGLYRIDPATGEELEYCPRVARFLAASPRRVYGIDPQGQLMIIDRETLELLASYDLRRFELGVLNTEDDRVYLSTRSGLIVCLHELGLETPVAHVEPESQPTLPPAEGE